MHKGNNEQFESIERKIIEKFSLKNRRSLFKIRMVKASIDPAETVSQLTEDFKSLEIQDSLKLLVYLVPSDEDAKKLNKLFDR